MVYTLTNPALGKLTGSKEFKTTLGYPARSYLKRKTKNHNRSNKSMMWKELTVRGVITKLDKREKAPYSAEELRQGKDPNSCPNSKVLLAFAPPVLTLHIRINTEKPTHSHLTNYSTISKPLCRTLSSAENMENPSSFSSETYVLQYLHICQYWHPSRSLTLSSLSSLRQKHLLKVLFGHWR